MELGDLQGDVHQRAEHHLDTDTAKGNKWNRLLVQFSNHATCIVKNVLVTGKGETKLCYTKYKEQKNPTIAY